MINEQSPLARPLETDKKPSHHISNHVPFYLLYYFTVYGFLLVIQFGMLVITVHAKWVQPPEKEPTWIFPIDVMLVSLLVIEVGVQVFVKTKIKQSWKGYFSSKEHVIDFIVAFLSFTMVVLDSIEKVHRYTANYEDINTGESLVGNIDLLRDLIRIARIFEFTYILNGVLHNKDWNLDSSLAMEGVL